MCAYLAELDVLVKYSVTQVLWTAWNYLPYCGFNVGHSLEILYILCQDHLVNWTCLFNYDTLNIFFQSRISSLHPLFNASHIILSTQSKSWCCLHWMITSCILSYMVLTWVNCTVVEKITNQLLASICFFTGETAFPLFNVLDAAGLEAPNLGSRKSPVKKNIAPIDWDCVFTRFSSEWKFGLMGLRWTSFIVCRCFQFCLYAWTVWIQLCEQAAVQCLSPVQK